MKQNVKELVVSYKVDEGATFLGKKVWSIDQLVKYEKDITFVMAVQPINVEDIEKVIKQYGDYKVIKPYWI